MINKKNILLTFDYELFFGSKSGSPIKCLIEPTDRLLDSFKKYNITATFFIDILYYIKLLESSDAAEDAALIKKQIQRIVLQGCRVELHIHPHWLDALYDKGEWSFYSYRRFRLQSLDPNEIFDLFRLCKKTLEGIAGEVSSNYRVIAFRAGGFCIQPFESLMPSFIQGEISIDSSVAPGFFGKSATHDFNFKNAPDISYYQFTKDPVLHEKNGIFYQLPISTYKKSFFSKLRMKVAKFISPDHFKVYGDGVGLYFPIRWWRKLLPSKRMFTLDGEMMPGELHNKIKESNREWINIISHPKSLSEISYLCLDKIASQDYIFINTADALSLCIHNKSNCIEKGL
jgi:hypothetical protein